MLPLGPRTRPRQLTWPMGMRLPMRDYPVAFVCVPPQQISLGLECAIGARDAQAERLWGLDSGVPTIKRKTSHAQPTASHHAQETIMPICAPASRARELAVGRVQPSRFTYGPPSMRLPGAQMKSVNLPRATGAEKHRGLQPATTTNTGRIAPSSASPWPSARSSLPRSRHAVHDSDWLAQSAQAVPISSRSSGTDLA
jgi:hypothetical protein